MAIFRSMAFLSASLRASAEGSTALPVTAGLSGSFPAGLDARTQFIVDGMVAKTLLDASVDGGTIPAEKIDSSEIEGGE